MTFTAVRLHGHQTWAPAALLAPSAADLWPADQERVPLASLATFVPVEGSARDDQAVVGPGNVDARSGAITGTKRGFAGLVRSVKATGVESLRPGDLLIPPAPSGHVILVGDEHGGFVFSSAFIALRPIPSVDGLWVWAVLNSDIGQRARSAIAVGATTPKVLLASLLELELPLPTTTWNELRPTVAELHQRAAAATATSEAGQSWWRMATLPPGRSWHIYVTTRTPELLEDGVPLSSMVERFVAGRRIDQVVDEPHPGWVPYLSSRDLRTTGKARGWAKNDGFVAASGDIAVAEIGRRGPATVLTESVLVGQGITLVRLKDPTLAARVVAYFNSEAGQAARAILATGATIPHFGPSALKAMRIPARALEAEVPATALPEPLGVVLDRALWS